MTRLWLLVLAGCGRVAFDATGDATGDAAGDAAPLDPSLRLWLRFAPDDLLRDTVTGNLATCTDCPTGATGPSGRGAVEMSGTQCLTFGDHPGLRPAELTVSAWVQPTDGGARQGSVVGKAVGSTTQNSFEFWMDDTGYVNFFTSDGTSNAGAFYNPVNVGEWIHLTGTFANGRTAIYVDGAYVREHTMIATVGYDAAPVRIGCDLDDGVLGQLVTGRIADVRLYDRALSDAEIGQLSSQ